MEARFQLGEILQEQGRPAEAMEQYESAVGVLSSHDRTARVDALMNLRQGELAVSRGDGVAAVDRLSKALVGYETAGEAVGALAALDGLAHLACIRGEFDLAAVYLRRAPEPWSDGKLPCIHVGTSLVVTLAKLCARKGVAERAVELLGLAQQHPATEWKTRLRIEALLTELRARFPPEKIVAALERGKDLRLEAVLEDERCLLCSRACSK